MESIAATGPLVSTANQEQINIQPKAEELGTSNENVQENIAKLAHALWQRRGCPAGSAEQDWIEAERLMNGAETKTAAAER